MRSLSKYLRPRAYAAKYGLNPRTVRDRVQKGHYKTVIIGGWGEIKGEVFIVDKK